MNPFNGELHKGYVVWEFFSHIVHGIHSYEFGLSCLQGPHHIIPDYSQGSMMMEGACMRLCLRDTYMEDVDNLFIRTFHDSMSSFYPYCELHSMDRRGPAIKVQ